MDSLAEPLLKAENGGGGCGVDIDRNDRDELK